MTSDMTPALEDEVPVAAERASSGELALDVKDLQTWFYTRQGIVKAVDGVSFNLRKGETLGIVGESGCGKSITALSVMRLVPDPPGRIIGGRVTLDGRDLLDLDESEMRLVRGNDISMIFQEPMTSLNPVLHDRQPDRGGASPAPAHDRPRGLVRAAEMLGDGAAFRRRRSAAGNTRTSSRAACGSGR